MFGNNSVEYFNRYIWHQTLEEAKQFNNRWDIIMNDMINEENLGGMLMKFNLNPCINCNTIPVFEKAYKYFFRTNWVYLKCNCMDAKGNNKTIAATGNTVDNAKIRATHKWNNLNPIDQNNVTNLMKEDNLT
jgi:hypothetical protein